MINGNHVNIQNKLENMLHDRNNTKAVIYFVLFAVGFGIGDFFTSSQINEKDSYWTYYNYPQIMRKFDEIFK